jgi:hypothetical protein
MTSMGHPSSAVTALALPPHLRSQAEIEEEVDAEVRLKNIEDYINHGYDVEIVYSVVGGTQSGVACDFGHEIEVVFEVQEPQEPAMRREWKSIEAACRDPLWESHIKLAVRAEI